MHIHMPRCDHHTIAHEIYTRSCFLAYVHYTHIHKHTALCAFNFRFGIENYEQRRKKGNNNDKLSKTDRNACMDFVMNMKTSFFICAQWCLVKQTKKNAAAYVLDGFAFVCLKRTPITKAFFAHVCNIKKRISFSQQKPKKKNIHTEFNFEF